MVDNKSRKGNESSVFVEGFSKGGYVNNSVNYTYGGVVAPAESYFISVRTHKIQECIKKINESLPTANKRLKIFE